MEKSAKNAYCNGHQQGNGRLNVLMKERQFDFFYRAGLEVAHNLVAQLQGCCNFFIFIAIDKGEGKYLRFAGR
jgi:hypothetical protein